MNSYIDLLTLLMAATGDNSKPLLVAICLIVSVVLTVVLLVTGRMANKNDEADENDEDE
ncbi:MAG: hypothetical protein IKL53_07355 [Lachnospiraceae bacterium]|nr:hypothetical protein [Lachnospiraceae bacterium]